MWCQISTQVYRFDRVVTRTRGAVSWHSKRRKTLQLPCSNVTFHTQPLFSGLVHSSCSIATLFTFFACNSISFSIYIPRATFLSLPEVPNKAKLLFIVYILRVPTCV